MAKLIFLLHRRVYENPLHFRSRNLSNVTQQQLHLDQTLAASVFSNPWFYLLGICKDVRSLKKVHGSLVVHGFVNHRPCTTKLVSLYGQFGRLDLARSLFDAIAEPDFYSWKVMIRWYFLNDLYREMIGFYQLMRVCQRELDGVVFSIVLKACSELRCLNEGKKVHSQIVKAGDPDSFVLTGLVDMYAKCGEVESARGVFDEHSDRSVVCWTSMIVGYVHEDWPRDGLVLFNGMREELIESNQYTLGAVVMACTKLGALHQGRWVHGYVVKRGIELNSHLVTALLDMYAKCGVLGDARRVFDELSSVDLVSWTAMIVRYTQSGHPKEALKLFMDKKWAVILPNFFTLSSVLSACANLGDLKLGKSVHGIGVKLGLESGVVANALVDMYAKCHMNIDARYVFGAISNKDVVAWNSLISGLLQSGSAYEALEMFHQMRMESVLLDAVTLVSALSASASLSALAIGFSLHAHSVKSGLLSANIYVGTSLLTFYSKCGDANSAREVFNHMADKNAVTWSAMIGGYGVQGDSGGSLKLFGDMLKDGVKPNEIIFTTILTACSHTGMVEEGRRLFISMCQDYNFEPSMKHYVCMVDLLARAGRLEEALLFIDKMPIQPDVSLFGAYLHGCGLHSRFDLGEVAIRRMLKLNPDKASYYVLMCNLYASDGRWAQVVHVRELMNQLGFIKSPGHSLVERNMNMAVHSE